jgi:glycosyltransferase involved in cell wall biosynthesis
MSTVSNYPLLSVLTPVYNGEKYLEETLQSLVKSHYPNLEFILVDDGSTDSSADIAERVFRDSGRPHKVIRKANSGEADSDNIALAESSGEFVAIVNCDDPVYPTLFGRSIEALLADSEAVVSYPDWDLIGSNGQLIKRIRVKDYTLDSLLGDNECLPGPGAVIRRNAIEGPILRDPRFRYTSDYRQWLNLSLKGKFIRVPESLCTWRIHDGQQTVAAAGITQAKEMIGCIDDLFRNENLPTSHLRLRKQAKSQALYLAAVQSLHRPGVAGRRYLLKSVAIVFRRAPGYRPNRRSLILALLIISNPFGRFAVKALRSRHI